MTTYAFESIKYQFKVGESAGDDLTSVDYYTGRRLTIRPRTVLVSSLGEGQLYVMVEGRMVRQSDGGLGGVRRIGFHAETTHHSDISLDEAPAWVREIAAWVVSQEGRRNG